MIGRGDTARAGVYRQLATMERAGVPLVTAMRRLADRGGAYAVLRPPLAAMEAGEDAGKAFVDAPGFSALERRVIRAGNASGTLPDAFSQLAELSEDRAKVKQQTLFSLAYPVFLLHAAVLLPALPVLVGKGVSAFLMASLVPLAVMWGLVIGGALAFRAARRANAQAVDRLVLAIPGVKGVARRRALALSLKALGVLYQSGVSILDALEAAHEVCPNRHLAQAFARIRANVSDGLEIGQAFALEGDAVTDVVVDMVSTGAQSGQLDTMLHKASEQLESDAKQARVALFAILGVGAFFAVAAYVGYVVITFYTGMINNALGAGS